MCGQKVLVVGCGSLEEILMDLTFNSNNLPNNVNSAASGTVDMSHGQDLRITTYNIQDLEIQNLPKFSQ